MKIRSGGGVRPQSTEDLRVTARTVNSSKTDLLDLWRVKGRSFSEDPPPKAAGRPPQLLCCLKIRLKASHLIHAGKSDDCDFRM